MTTYKLSPSSLTFDWDGCKFCFYMQVKHNIRMGSIFPGIFTKMANLTSGFYLGKPTSEISPSLPPGVVKMREGYVTSAPIAIPGAASQCYIKGRFDALLEFDDGSYGLVDYKTSDARDEHAAFYSRQLSAYAYSLEHPAAGALSFTPVNRLGLFIITPDRFEPTAAAEMAFVNRTTWVDVPRDDDAFLALLGEVLRVLDAPEPPASSADCEVCNYRARMRAFQEGQGE